MKKGLLTVFSIIMLTFAVGTASWGAVHPYTGNTTFFNFFDFDVNMSYPYNSGFYNVEPRGYINNGWSERWFSVDRAVTKLQFQTSFFKDNANVFGGEYYENDQTFAGLNYLATSSGNNSVTNFRGSYLFDFGVFGGIDYSFINGDYIALVAPGYRFNLGNQGYIAASLDYGMSSLGSDNKILSYEINGVYYPEKTKIYGEVSIPNQEAFPSVDPFYLVGANFNVEDDLVCGLAYINLGNNDYRIFGGATYAPDKLILNGIVGASNVTGSDTTFYVVGGSYRFTDILGTGIEYYRASYRDQGRISGRLDLYLESGVLEVGYVPENGAIGQEQIITAAYKQNI